MQNITCTLTSNLFFSCTQVHCRIVFHWSKLIKVLQPPPFLPWNLTPVTSHSGFGFSVTQAVPENLLSVWRSPVSKGSLPKPHCHSWKRIAAGANESSSILMKYCEWNNWTRTGDYFLSYLFIKSPRDNFPGILLGFLFQEFGYRLSGIRNKKYLSVDLSEMNG